MLLEKIVELLDDQINKEFLSSYEYLAMANYCESIGFDGAASWLKKQSKEEIEHAEKIISYLQDQQVRPALKPIPQPKLEYESLRDVFDSALLAEKTTTQSINNIANCALAEKDHATYAFIQWFVNEQVEEEKQAQWVADKVRLLNQNLGLLYTLDKELGKRE